LKLSPGSGEPSLEMHYRTGVNLEQRGRSDWAAKEWEHVIQNAPPRSEVGIAAAHLLAELYHDLEEDQRAAETLGRIEKAYAKRSNQWSLFNEDGTDATTLGMLRARRCFFDACRWKVQGDRTRQRECLDKALATQCYDIEVLIDCYQLPDSPAGYRTKIRALIEKRLCGLREQIADIGPKSAAAGPCNEFAWLAANTEGDLDEALRLSKRSLELSGEQGEYCDTLARVYFAKGDYAGALRHQSRAAELLPGNRAVQEQLLLFRKKAREIGITREQIDKIEKAAAPVEKAAVPIEKATAPDDNPFGSFKPRLPAYAHDQTSRC
jgi:tetratricopeptide (TPR) repeat protein